MFAGGPDCVVPPLDGDNAGAIFVDPLLVSPGEFTDGWLTAGGVEAGGGDVGEVVDEPVVCPGAGAGGETGAVVVVCAVDVGAIDGLFRP